MRGAQHNEQVGVTGLQQSLVGPSVARASTREVDVGDDRALDRWPAVVRLRRTRPFRRGEECVNLGPKPFRVCLVHLAGEGSAPDGGASEVSFDLCAVRFKAYPFEEVSFVKFPDDFVESFLEEKLTVATDERRLNVE